MVLWGVDLCTSGTALQAIISMSGWAMVLHRRALRCLIEIASILNVGMPYVAVVSSYSMCANQSSSLSGIAIGVFMLEQCRLSLNRFTLPLQGAQNTVGHF